MAFDPEIQTYLPGSYVYPALSSIPAFNSSYTVSPAPGVGIYLDVIGGVVTSTDNILIHKVDAVSQIELGGGPNQNDIRLLVYDILKKLTNEWETIADADKSVVMNILEATNLLDKNTLRRTYIISFDTGVIDDSFAAEPV